tara:strand:- start:23487 stop:23936 length:450 start_codon:yes stop_codon:yes gene_type:complete
MSVFSYNLIRKQQGFTLIEVLVAAVILFTSIALVSNVYRGAFLSSDKADKHLVINSVLPAILATVRDDIRTQSYLADSVIKRNSNMWGINYKWEANLIDFKSAPERFDVDFGYLVTPPKKYKLWHVTLIISKGNSFKTFNYNELGWNGD